MATKTEMIEYILQHTENNESELNQLNYSMIKKIYDEIEVFDTDEEIIEEKKDTKVFTIEINDMSDAQKKELMKILNEKYKETITIEEEEVVDYFSLSPVQRRAYQRSGIIPKRK